MVYSSFKLNKFELSTLTGKSWKIYLSRFSLYDLTPKSWDDLLKVFQQCILPLQNQNRQMIIKQFNVLPKTFSHKIYAQICLERGDTRIFNALSYGGINFLIDWSDLSSAIQNVACLTFDQLDHKERDYVKSAWQSRIEKGDFRNITLSEAHTEVLINCFRELCLPTALKVDANVSLPENSTFIVKQSSAKSTNPLEYLPQPAPDWKTAYSYYYGLKQQVAVRSNLIDPVSDKILSEIILLTLKQHSSCPKGSELQKHNYGLSRQMMNLRYKNCLQKTKIPNFHQLDIIVFSDLTQKAKFYTSAIFDSCPILIDIFFCDKTSNQYLEGLNEYNQLSKGPETTGDIELYCLKTGITAGPTGVAYPSKTVKEYDLFESSNSITGKHRIAIAMNEVYGVKESTCSAVNFSADEDRKSNLQGDIACSVLKSNTCNLCNQYILAYLLARQRCNSHTFILNFFRQQLIINSEEFISIIAGIGDITSTPDNVTKKMNLPMDEERF